MPILKENQPQVKEKKSSLNEFKNQIILNVMVGIVIGGAVFAAIQNLSEVVFTHYDVWFNCLEETGLEYHTQIIPENGYIPDGSIISHPVGTYLRGDKIIPSDCSALIEEQERAWLVFHDIEIDGVVPAVHIR